MLKDFTKEKFDILILAGQSNADGTAFGPVENPYHHDDRIWQMNGDFTVCQAAEAVWRNHVMGNFGLPFAREYAESGFLREGRKILILRTAVGATGFLDKRWGMKDDLFLRMIEMIRTALELNPENRLVALLWHQGETDAYEKATYDQHYTHLSDLLHAVRDTFEVPRLPFVTADFVQHWKSENLAIATPVIEAIRGVCRDNAPAAFVETDRLNSNYQELKAMPQDWEDHIHFSRKSIYELGKRYFDAYLSLLAEEESEPQ